jgi:hypothetical protein
MHTSSASLSPAGRTRVAPVQYRVLEAEPTGARCETERTFLTGNAGMMWARIRLYRLSGFSWLHALRAATHPKAKRVTLTTLAPRARFDL